MSELAMSEPITPNQESAVVSASAPIWRRLIALIYDLFLLLALSMTYGAIAVAGYVATTGDRGEAYSPMFDSPLFGLGWVLVLMGFYCFFWYRGGQTLGMRAWRLKLVSDHESETLTFKQCLRRALLGPLALLAGGAGYWWRWFDRDQLCLHDRFSSTRVVVLAKHKP